MGAGPAGDDLIIDFDATSINTTADKQDARPNYKRGYGHHPLLAIIAETDEILCGELRPGLVATAAQTSGGGTAANDG